MPRRPPPQPPVLHSAVTNAFDAPWDLTNSKDRTAYRDAALPDADWTRIDVSVPTSDKFMDLIDTKAMDCNWSPVVNVPISGTGIIAPAPIVLASGEKTYDAGFTTRRNIITHYNDVTPDVCFRFSAWCQRGESAVLADPLEPDYTRRHIVPINPNHPDENTGFVNRFKIQYRIVANLITATFKSHLTLSAFKSFLPYKNEFAYTEPTTGKIVFDGLLLLRMSLNICKPDTHIDVRDLEQELDVITLSSCKHDANDMISQMLRTYQEIHARTGRASYTPRRFITNLFRASEECMIPPFVFYVTFLKQQWINDEITDEYSIAKKLTKMAKNLIADKKWTIDTTKEAKVVALATEVETLRREMATLRNPPSPDSTADYGTALSRVPAADLWAVTYAGDTTAHDGRKYAWCTQHKSRDRSIIGRYMPHPHNHAEWAAARAARSANKKRGVNDAVPNENKRPKQA